MTPSSSWTSRRRSTRAWGSGGGFDVELVDARPGFAVLRVTGPAAAEVFAQESGGHRWQRVPPTEKRGRVQTSTVTVAVLAEPGAADLRLDERDLEWATCRGSGPGGQHRNKTESAVVVTHRPTGTSVRCESERSQHRNREAALAILRARLWEAQRARQESGRAADRRAQVGLGQRGDKRRTIRCQDGQVTDHVTGKRWNLRDYLRGEW